MIRKGSPVQWTSNDRTLRGKVLKTYDYPVRKVFAGIPLLVFGKTGNKALWIKKSDGTETLLQEEDVSRDG